MERGGDLGHESEKSREEKKRREEKRREKKSGGGQADGVAEIEPGPDLALLELVLPVPSTSSVSRNFTV